MSGWTNGEVPHTCGFYIDDPDTHEMENGRWVCTVQQVG